METLIEALCRIAKTQHPLEHKLDLMREEAVANQEFELAAFLRLCMMRTAAPTEEGK